MRKKNIIVLAALACMSVHGFAQNGDIKGLVLDKYGKPIEGALITVTGKPSLKATSGRDGSFTIEAGKATRISVYAPDKSQKTVDVKPGEMKIVMNDFDRSSNIGYDKDFSLSETTASVSTVSGELLAKRTSRDITQSLFGYLPGLTTMQSSGLYANSANAFTVRGVKSLTGNSPLVLVDGIERDATYITPEEVENVTILKDAAAVALYGYKGSQGVINITTKRGKYNTSEIKFSYDQMISWNTDVPDFVDGYTYAKAYNEALANEGKAAKYDANALQAYKSGKYPSAFPSINWADETFRSASPTSIANLSLRGGSEKFRYFTLANLQVNKGFIKNAFENSGYSTQNKYSRASLRTNLDADLTNNTKMEVNLLGTLAETSKPGTGADLWNYVYNVPSNAFPIRLDNGAWGGSSDISGTMNPVAQAEGAAYVKQHIRSLYADMTLRQDFSSILKGLGGSATIAYDNLAAYYEDRSKGYRYGSYTVTGWNNGEPVTSYFEDGKDEEMGTSNQVKTYRRNFYFDALLNYTRTFGKHSVYGQLKWDYEYNNKMDIGNTYYRQNASLYAHYAYNNKYIADVTLVASAANRLSPDDRWAFSPTVSAGWVISNEAFMKNISWIDFLKLRASWGIINSDRIPSDGYWEQTYGKNQYYAFGSDYSLLDDQGWRKGTLAVGNSTHEKSTKYNVGLDMSLFKGLNITADAYYERYSDIWVDASSKYSSVLGQTVPYENAGIVDAWGTEIGVDYTKRLGQVTINVGGTFSYARNKVKDKLEKIQIYQNLVSTGLPVGQLFGLKAIGLFKDQADIDNSPKQTFSTVYPGDIKYEDVNGDNKIDANDVVAIGHGTTTPETYYTINLGAEWKGLGFTALFQGVGRYSSMLNAAGLYRPLMGKTSLSEYYYKNRWTVDNPNALFPRLSTQSNSNNYRNSTFWLRDGSFFKLRNIEVYYNFPKSVLSALKIVNNAKIYVRGNDLFTLDHIAESTPEQLQSANNGATNPLTRSVVFGLQVGF